MKRNLSPKVFLSKMPVCLICNEVVTVCKEHNTRQHQEIKYCTFIMAFLLQSRAGRCEIKSLTASYACSSKSLTAQQKVMSASLKVTWVGVSGGFVFVSMFAIPSV